MNYLAHLYLSDNTPHAQLGNLLGDFVKGNDLLAFPEEVQRAFDHSLNRAEAEDLGDTCHLNEKKKVARVDDGFKH